MVFLDIFSDAGCHVRRCLFYFPRSFLRGIFAVTIQPQSQSQPQQTTTVSKEVLDRRREAKRQRIETFSAPTGTVNRVSMNELDGFQTVDDMSGDLPF